LDGLQANGSYWAKAQLAILQTKSPQALKVTLRQLREGRGRASFADEMAVEFCLAVRVCRRHDFREGVRAVIVDKDNAPRWDPKALADVDEALLDALFEPLPPGQAWTPL
jgi:enoyl-CoA hydratase